MFRRLCFVLLCAMLSLLAVPALANAAPGDVTITAPGNDGEDPTPLIQGTADASLPVHVLIDGDEVAAVTPAADGTWEYQVTEAFTFGSFANITAQIRDDGGEVVGSVGQSYYVWEEPSTIEISVPSHGDPITRSFDVIGQVTTPMQMTQDFTLLMDGSEVPTFYAFMDSLSGELTIRVQDADLDEGPHELSVVGTDVHGRSATSEPVTVIVDTTPPSKPVVTSHHNGDVITDRTPTFAGTADPGTPVELEFYGSGEPLCDDVADATGKWSCEPTGHGAEWIDYMEGKRDQVTIVVGSRDPAGNVAASQFTVIVDFRTVGGGTGTTTPKPTPPTSSPKPASSVTSRAPGDGGSNASGTPPLANTGASPTAPLLVAGLLLVVGFSLRRVSGFRHRA
ncbi:MAG: hypothetical protein ABIW49_05680 [Knoellia sp.]